MAPQATTKIASDFVCRADEPGKVLWFDAEHSFNKAAFLHFSFLHFATCDPQAPIVY